MYWLVRIGDADRQTRSWPLVWFGCMPGPSFPFCHCPLDARIGIKDGIDRNDESNWDRHRAILWSAGWSDSYWFCEPSSEDEVVWAD
jgi:hypothetical protein